jgi:hypothetical protein
VLVAYKVLLAATNRALDGIAEARVHPLFFCKSVFHTKATPFMRAEPFLGKFLAEGA